MFTVPDLPYAYNSLEPFIDEETMHLHHDKHHVAYVANLNDVLKEHSEWLTKPVEEILTNLDSFPDTIRLKVRNNAGGHWNHTFFWSIMGPKSEQKPGEVLTRAIERSFESISGMQEKVNAAGLARFGSGWVWIIKNGDTLEVKDTPNQDSPLMEGKHPILGIDVWEHAYYLKYKNVRSDYLKAWWNIVNWQEVEKNFSSLK